jgi:hypothetical protein
MEEELVFPVNEAMKIQEAFKPLGYMVHGYRDGWVTKSRLVTVELRTDGARPYRKRLDYPGDICDVGVNEPDNGLHGAE